MAGTVKDLGNRVVYRGKRIAFEGSGLLESDAIVLKDDFLGDTFDANLWSSQADAGATAAAVSVAAGGMARLVTGTTSGARADMAGEVVWLPSKGLIFEARVKVSAITAVRINLGLSDAKTETEIAVTQSGTTLTTAATDGVFWFFDTDSTNDNWHAVGVKADVDTAASNSSIAPVADTYQRFRIEIDTSGNAVCKILDDSNPHSGAPLYQTYLANACTAATLLTPYLAVETANTTSKNFDIDYVFAAQLAR